MELEKRCTCAGGRSDSINRHSFSVNDSLPGLLFIPEELLADEFKKGKDKPGKPLGSVYNSAPAFKEFKSGASPPPYLRDYSVDQPTEPGRLSRKPVRVNQENL